MLLKIQASNLIVLNISITPKDCVQILLGLDICGCTLFGSYVVLLSYRIVNFEGNVVSSLLPVEFEI